MQCSWCENKAVITTPARCKEHFVKHFENRVWETIERFSLLPEGKSICVAASGGKDSLALLAVLSQRYEVDALCIDEGIAGYRDSTINDLCVFCQERNIPLRVVSFADLGAKPLDEQNPSHPCSACGVLRRKALLDFTTSYDIIATGHNLDDEAQTILMNLLRNQKQLMKRIGPRTPSTKGIAVRVKPFYLTPEREVRAYCLVQGITSNFSECPNIVKSFRWKVGEALNDLEVSQPSSKLNIVEEFLARWYESEPVVTSDGTCQRCGGPASHKLCRACKLLVVEDAKI